MVAQSMHRLSARRDFAFVAINCGAFPEALLESELFGYEEGAFTGARKGGKAGLIEVAHRGTLFLDEIGEMPLSLQSRLLRVLQEREVVRLGSTEPTRVDIRVVAATHRALTEGIAAGRFRADLYYRLNILSIALPRCASGPPTCCRSPPNCCCKPRRVNRGSRRACPMRRPLDACLRSLPSHWAVTHGRATCVNCRT